VSCSVMNVVTKKSPNSVGASALEAMEEVEMFSGFRLGPPLTVSGTMRSYQGLAQGVLNTPIDKFLFRNRLDDWRWMLQKNL
jgi:hypothetical protein